MTARYSGHLLRTRQQAFGLCLVMLFVLAPLVAWRAVTHDTGLAVALLMLTLSVFAVAFQTWRFLEAQERIHPEPTPEMTFVFRFLANTPLTFGALIIVILVGLD